MLTSSSCPQEPGFEKRSSRQKARALLSDLGSTRNEPSLLAYKTMRNGFNPMRGAALAVGYPLHRIIIPVHIPVIDGYYSDAWSILRVCLTSLQATLGHGKANITVIDNGCADEVRNWLLAQVRERAIDQLVINRDNRGKPDSIFGAARASYEQFITFSDADVLFKQGWLEAVEEVFAVFPEAGLVSPFPGIHVRHLHCIATWLRHLRELRRCNVVNKEDLVHFGQSTQNVSRYSAIDWDGQWCVVRNGLTAVIGAVHFVVTCRKAVIEAMDSTPSCVGLGVLGSKGLRQLDGICDLTGFSKLSTPNAYVRHMGNRFELWMETELQATIGSAGCRPNTPRLVGMETGKPGWPRFIPRFLHSIISKVIARVEWRVSGVLSKKSKGGIEVNPSGGRALE